MIFEKHIYHEQEYFDGHDLLTYSIGPRRDYFKLNGLLHRADGPALIEKVSGFKDDNPIRQIMRYESYWLFGNRYDSLPSAEEFERLKKEWQIENVLL